MHLNYKGITESYLLLNYGLELKKLCNELTRL